MVAWRQDRASVHTGLSARARLWSAGARVRVLICVHKGSSANQATCRAVTHSHDTQHTQKAHRPPTMQGCGRLTRHPCSWRPAASTACLCTRTSPLQCRREASALVTTYATCHLSNRVCCPATAWVFGWTVRSMYALDRNCSIALCSTCCSAHPVDPLLHTQVRHPWRQLPPPPHGLPQACPHKPHIN